MNTFLRKIKLLDTLTVELEIDKNSFVSKLKEQVDKGSTGMLSDTFDVFSSSKNEYKGHVDHNGFKIKRRKRLFDMNMNVAVAEGTFSQKYETLVIKTEINSFHNMMYVFLVFIFLFYGLFIGSIFWAEGGDSLPYFVLPILLIHGLLMIGIPYLLMRRSTKKMKRELEREFFYLTKK